MAGTSVTGEQELSLALENPSKIPSRSSSSLIFAAGHVAGVWEKAVPPKAHRGFAAAVYGKGGEGEEIF